MNKKGEQDLSVPYEEDSHDRDATVTNPCAGEGSERPLPTCEDCGCKLSASDIQLELKICFWCDHETWTRETNHG